MGGGAEPKSRPSRLAFHHRQCPHETETFVSKDSCLTEYYAEPPGYNLAVDWEWLDVVLEAGLRRFPILEHAGLAEKLCWAGAYEITPDHMPILGRHPELEGYVDASGFSGHGVMHAPATGLLIAEEILDGRAHTIDIDPLRINRFRGVLKRELNVI